ncbi:MAG: hypothetical protein JWQ35_2145 [Bacteriovoracaceae bacterium]|nr:hypothetical protein [Bacteriovoracaceae bacterium]
MANEMHENRTSSTSRSTRYRLLQFFEKIGGDHLLTQAAALSYYALLSLAPLSVAALIVWTFFSPLPSEDLMKFVDVWLSPQASNAIRLVLTQTERPHLRVWASSLTLLSVFIFGTAVFNQLQSSFDLIWKKRTAPVRNWFIQRLLSILIFGCLLLLFFCSSIFIMIVKKLDPSTRTFLNPILSIAVFAFLLMAITALYRWFSKKQIPWGAAFQSALIATILFEFGKILFQIYIHKAAVSSAYGAAGTVIVFLFWMFYSALLVLVGAEIAFQIKDHPWAWAEKIRNIAVYRRHRYLFWSLVIFLTIVLAARILAPSLIKYEINHQLDLSKTWKGRIEDVDLGVLSGTLKIQNGNISKTTKDLNLNFRLIEITIAWLALLKKEIHLKALISNPLIVLNIGVSQPGKEAQPKTLKRPSTSLQTKNKVLETKQALSEKWPIYIDTLKVKHLEFDIEDSKNQSIPSFQIRDLNLEAENIWNHIQKQSGPSNIRFSGVTSGNGRLTGKIWLSAFAPTPNLKAQIELKSLDLRAFNSFFRKKGNFDLKQGKFDMYMEAASKNWRVDGYIKPILSNVKFIDLKARKKESFFRRVWESLLQLIAGIVKNPQTKRVAGKIPFSGRLDDPSTSASSALVSILKNAFIQALSTGFEGHLKIAPTFPSSKP